MPINVILDSNFLLAPIELHTDIFSKIEGLLLGKVRFIVISPAYKEIVKLANRKDKVGKKASSALKLLERCEILEVRPRHGESVDDLIVKASKELKAIVATKDYRLKKRLRRCGVPVIFLKDSEVLCEPMTPEYF
ncbi:MAG: 30S processome protein Utp24 [Candidatus Bathyarchaeia archaeon]